MLHAPLFKPLFLLIAVIATLHISAINLYLYWSIWWFDMMMHFLGGLWISLSLLWFLFLSGYTRTQPGEVIKVISIAILGAFLIGILWEYFEWSEGISYPQAHFAFDTISDVVCDLIGGFVGGFIFFRKYLRRSSI